MFSTCVLEAPDDAPSAGSCCLIEPKAMSLSEVVQAAAAVAELDTARNWVKGVWSGDMIFAVTEPGLSSDGARTGPTDAATADVPGEARLVAEDASPVEISEASTRIGALARCFRPGFLVRFIVGCVGG